MQQSICRGREGERSDPRTPPGCRNAAVKRADFLLQAPGSGAACTPLAGLIPHSRVIGAGSKEGGCDGGFTERGTKNEGKRSN